MGCVLINLAAGNTVKGHQSLDAHQLTLKTHHGGSKLAKNAKSVILIRNWAFGHF